MRAPDSDHRAKLTELTRSDLPRNDDRPQRHAGILYANSAPQARSDSPALSSVRTIRRCPASVILSRAAEKCPGNIRCPPDLHVVAAEAHPAQRALAQEIFERGAHQLWISLFIKGHEQRLPGQFPPPYNWNQSTGRITVPASASRSERHTARIDDGSVEREASMATVPAETRRRAANPRSS